MSSPTLELIRGVPFFAALTDGDASALAAEFDEREYKAGSLVVAEGQHGYAFFVVESGEASIAQQGAEVGRLGPGDAFGELALFDPDARRSASITALTDLRCWSLPIYAFRPFIASRPAVAWQLLEHLAVRLRRQQA